MAVSFNQPISKTVWDIKYRYRQGEHIIDQTLEDTWKRVAHAVASVEKGVEKRRKWQNKFYQILEDFHFLPGGRILAGAGTEHSVTLFNCFVMNIAEDSLTGIFEAIKEGALTLQQGGGIGYDFSVLRPQGDIVGKIGIPASGPVSFMRIWDTMCSVMLSTGARRGAMMGILRCDHPDIESFIAAKANPQELRHFNVSVSISDAFMQAVARDEEWPLIFPVHGHEEEKVIYRYWGNSSAPLPCKIYKTVKARALWQKIIRSAYDYAEPGVIFGDTINRLNTLWYCERISATNPCGEIPLPPYGACDLGAINLTRFVISPFSQQAKLDWERLDETVNIATRFLDNVIDVSNYPIKAQQKQAINTRRIGLGMTGLADTFVMLGMRYGSAESIKFADQLMKRMAYTTWYASVELAREKGIFPLFSQSYCQGEFVRTLDMDLQTQIARYGIRNSHHNTIAPTGTTSLLANNVSNGIEPIFRAEYDRHMRTVSGDSITFRVQDFAYELWQKQQAEQQYPPAWVDTEHLTPDAHIKIQSVMQKYIDNSISKTINIPEHFPFAELADIYTKAYEQGLKGCTIFRPNAITGSVLEVPEEHCCQFEDEERGSK